MKSLGETDEPGATLARELGPQIRELRKARGLTLKQLAHEIGKTAGFISQIEREQARPSISTLQEIGRALGVPFAWFVPQDDAGKPQHESQFVVRTNNRRRLRYNDAITGSGFADDLLSPHLRGNMVAAHTRFAPGGRWGPYEVSKEYEVAIYVLAGQLKVDHLGEVYVLSEGDFFQYALAPDSPYHEISNASDHDEAKFIWIGSPVVLDF